jgi:formylmethanofuran dehydrogenase subunit A
MISGIKPIYDVSHDKRIDNYNVYLYGNHGYNGTEKMIKSISKMHKQYFLVNILDYKTDDKYSQTNKKITKYIIDNSKLIEEKDGFWLYYKE